jgi:hypothetical protein
MGLRPEGGPMEIISYRFVVFIILSGKELYKEAHLQSTRQLLSQCLRRDL